MKSFLFALFFLGSLDINSHEFNPAGLNSWEFMSNDPKKNKAKRKLFIKFVNLDLYKFYIQI